MEKTPAEGRAEVHEGKKRENIGSGILEGGGCKSDLSFRERVA